MSVDIRWSDRVPEEMRQFWSGYRGREVCPVSHGRHRLVFRCSNFESIWLTGCELHTEGDSVTIMSSQLILPEPLVDRVEMWIQSTVDVSYSKPEGVLEAIFLGWKRAPMALKKGTPMVRAMRKARVLEE